MSQVNAGDIITLSIEGGTIKAKVEDASKSESIMAKIQSSTAPNYSENQVYEFDRSLLK